MGLISSIIISVIVLVIALVIVQAIFNPYYSSSLKNSLTHTATGVINNAQNASIQAIAASQSNKPILYIAENNNNTIAIFDMQFNKILGLLNLNGASVDNVGIVFGNVYATGSYYNYHNPQFHGIISIVNTSNNNLVKTISMISVPTQIALSQKNANAYTLNSNGSISEINLKSDSVINTIPFSMLFNYTPNIPTANCIFLNNAASCNGVSGSATPVIKWNVVMHNVPDILQNFIVFSKNYSSSSFSDNYTLPPPLGAISTPYVIYVTAYTKNSTYQYQFYQNQQEAIQQGANYRTTPSIQPTELLYGLNGTQLYILTNYTYECPYSQFCFNETLFTFNTSNNKISKRIILDAFTDFSNEAITLSPDGHQIYLLGGNGNNNYPTVYTVNSSTGSLIGTIPLNGNYGYGDLSMSPLGDYLYVTQDSALSYYGGYNIDVINTSTRSIVDSISAKGQLYSTAVSSILVKTNYTYVIEDSPSSSIQIISRKNDTIIGNVGIAGCPCEIVSN